MAIVDFGDRDNAAARRGQKHLTVLPEFVVGQGACFHQKARFGSHIERGLPRDAVKNTMIRGDEAVAEDSKDVESGAFGHMALVVEQRRDLVTVVLGLKEAWREIAPIGNS